MSSAGGSTLPFRRPRHPNELETVTYLGASIDVYRDGVVVVLPSGVIRRFQSMSVARTFVRRSRRSP